MQLLKSQVTCRFYVPKNTFDTFGKFCNNFKNELFDTKVYVINMAYCNHNWH